MTYREMTKTIRQCDKMIGFMYDIQKEKLDVENKEEAMFCGVIINILCSYKNHLIYEKQYEPVDNK